MFTRLPVVTRLRRASALAVPALCLALVPGLSGPSVAAPAPSSAPSQEPAEPGGSLEGWRVSDLGGGRYEVSWTAPARLPLGSDRPTIVGPELLLGPPTVGADGRTVTAVATADVAPDPAALDVVLSGDRLDEPGRDVTASTGTGDPAGTTAQNREPLGVDPAAPGPFTTLSSDYELPKVALPGMPKKVEMVGHIVEPAADQVTGPRPLVLFLHGRHEYCYDPTDSGGPTFRWPCRAPLEEIPSHLGYVYLQELLASQGYATVSIRANGINAQDGMLDDGGALARGLLVQRHLDHWVDLATEHQVDLSQVILVGHSRGGEGVDRAGIQIPLSAPYRIAGQVLLAPTDFASHTAPYIPTVTVLPACDGDVSDLQGQRFVDTARDIDPGDTALRSSVMVLGANHNFFNTEWTPRISAAPSSDDWFGPAEEPCGRKHPGRLTAREQRDAGEVVVAGAVQLFTGDDATLPLFDGTPVEVPSLGEAQVLSHAIGGGRDDRRPGLEATPTNAAGLSVDLCQGRSSFTPGGVEDCGSGRSEIAPHWVTDFEGTPARPFAEISWRRTGAVGGLLFEDPLDLSSDRLEIRAIVDPTRGPAAVRVRITDSAGQQATLDPVGGTELPMLPDLGEATKLWAQSIVVDASGASGIDLADIVSVEFETVSARGRIWVADLAAAPATLAAVPAVRLPSIDLGDLTVREGNSRGVRVARIPFTIDGTLSAPAKLTGLLAGYGPGSRQRVRLDLAPGQTRGAVRVTYLSDRLDNPDTESTLTLWPLRGIATNDYVGTFVVADDDPDARVVVRPTATRVDEGDSIVFRARLTHPSAETVYVSMSPVRGSGRGLSQADVPASWIERHGAATAPADPLWKASVYLTARIKPSQRVVEVAIPTVADRRREGPEKLTVSIYLGDRNVTRTITVRDTSR